MAERSRVFNRKGAGASDAIERAEAVLDVLRLTKVDLAAPDKLLGEAREAAAGKDFPRAEALAKRAESIATRLDERYRLARKSLAEARELVKNAKSAGLNVADLELAIEEARKVAREGMVEDGITVPNYLQARSLLDVAVNTHRQGIEAATAVANEIYTAEISADALKDANGSIDREAFERGVMRGIRALVDNAKLLFSKGRYEEAKAVALAAQGDATKARQDYEAAVAAFRGAEKILADLRGEGAVAVGPDRKLEEGQALLRQARLAEARAALTKVRDDAARLGEVFHRASKDVTAMAGAIAVMGRSGEVPEDAQHAVQAARRALEEGRYGRAEERLLEVRQALEKRRSVRERLALSIQETKAQVEVLRATGSEYANDVEEMVLRAEKEFANGDLVNSSEDLKIATLLMGKGRPAELRSATPK